MVGINSPDEATKNAICFDRIFDFTACFSAFPINYLGGNMQIVLLNNTPSYTDGFITKKPEVIFENSIESCRIKPYIETTGENYE